ncbi:MAG: SPFH domain-containing protein [Bryobacteraceae bacterium]|nr:SPFH domain-containing protein [Bryobacteraceae bacterium]
MAFIDSIHWSPQSNAIFAAKIGEENLSTFTQLVVAESQEAVLFSKGRIVGKFGPGKHTLNTENLPLLRNLFGIPFGGNNPFRAEVWFVSKTMPLNIEWTTGSMRYHDPDYQEMLPVVSSGRYGLKVVDAERFLVKLVGSLTEFTARQLTDHFKGALVSRTKSVVLSYMRANQVGIKQISGHLDQLSAFLQQSMAEFWEDYGFSLIGFYITSIDVDSESDDGRLILEAMSKRSAQNIAGYTWQQERALGVVGDALSHSGDSGLLGALLLTGGVGGSGMGAAMMQPPGSPPGPAAGPAAPQAPRREVFCSRCAKKYSTGVRFCPHCGDPFMPCPKCGTDNDEKAKRCVTCGTHLGGGVCCPKCTAPLPSGAEFCSACGTPARGLACQRCGRALEPAARFCPGCGNQADRV